MATANSIQVEGSGVVIWSLEVKKPSPPQQVQVKIDAGEVLSHPLPQSRRARR
jgi:hypothetical protein